MAVWTIAQLNEAKDDPNRPYNYLMDDPKNREALEHYAKLSEKKAGK
jgi:hypothetical protein